LIHSGVSKTKIIAPYLRKQHFLSQKKNLDRETALAIALDFQDKTKDLYKKCEIGGSIRRKEPTVHDIDFAVIPADKDFAAWKEKVSKRVASIGGSVKSFGEVISDFIYEGVQVNLFICPDEDSWGITLMWATGPRGHTIGMNIKAEKKNLLANSQGIFTRGEPRKRIPVRTEEDVGRVLGWKYKPPETRGKPVRKDQSAL
jgi:DNA polymerase/3'-5' exonuclease PolX